MGRLGVTLRRAFNRGSDTRILMARAVNRVCRGAFQHLLFWQESQFERAPPCWKFGQQSNLGKRREQAREVCSVAEDRRLEGSFRHSADLPVEVIHSAGLDLTPWWAEVRGSALPITRIHRGTMDADGPDAYSRYSCKLPVTPSILFRTLLANRSTSLFSSSSNSAKNSLTVSGTNCTSSSV